MTGKITNKCLFIVLLIAAAILSAASLLSFSASLLAQGAPSGLEAVGIPPVVNHQPNGNFDSGLAGQMQVKALPLLTSEQVYEAYSTYEKNGQFVFYSDFTKPYAKRFNVLNSMPALSDEQREKLYGISACGKRGFQLFSVPFSGDLDAINIIYPCNNRCQAIHEIHQMVNGTDQLSAISDGLVLPNQFCEALWNGMVHASVVGND